MSKKNPNSFLNFERQRDDIPMMFQNNIENNLASSFTDNTEDQDIVA